MIYHIMRNKVPTQSVVLINLLRIHVNYQRRWESMQHKGQLRLAKKIAV